MESLQQQQYSKRSNPNEPQFFYIPESHFIIMSLITLGLFNTYWIYRNWKYIKEKDDLDIIPFWRAVFGLFFIHSLLNEIANDNGLNKVDAPTFSASVLATGWVVMNVFGNVLARSENLSFGSIGILISISSFIFLLPVQNYIHHINKTANQNLAYSPWSFGQTLCVMIGTPLLILALTGSFLS